MPLLKKCAYLELHVMNATHKCGETKGFSLVELMIVVTIIGIASLLAFPSFKKVRLESRITTFLNDLRHSEDAFELYAMANGDYPAAAPAGQVPAGMGDYLKRTDYWKAPTSLGGLWKWDRNSAGISAGVTVSGADVSLFGLRGVDERIDDGNLNAGRFRQTASGYSYVIKD